MKGHCQPLGSAEKTERPVVTLQQQTCKASMLMSTSQTQTRDGNKGDAHSIGPVLFLFETGSQVARTGSALLLPPRPNAGNSGVHHHSAHVPFFVLIFLSNEVLFL